MTKKKTSTPSTSTLKARRRNMILDAIAARITGDPSSAWSAVGTAFSGKIMPVKITPQELTNKRVKAQVIDILKAFMRHADAMPEEGMAEDLVKVLKAVPRKGRG